MPKLAFFHDHIFSKYKDDFYSPGKLDYNSLSYYLKFFSSLKVVARYKDVVSIDSHLSIANGKNISIQGVWGPLSKEGIRKRHLVCKSIYQVVDESDYVVVRLPSEIGLIALKYALKNNKKTAVEVVANAYDCIISRGTIASRLYAPVAELRNKKWISKSKNVIYVTRGFLQKKYPCANNTASATDAVITPLAKAKCSKLNSEEIRLGFIGDPSTKLKGFKYLYQAVELLKRKGYNISLDVVGNKGVPSSFSIQDYIKFNGVITDRDTLFNWISEIDIYIQPSLTEGLPRSVLEAMSMGKPCMGSNVGGMSELIHPSALFPAKNYLTMAEKIENIIRHPELYTLLVNHSLTVSQDYSFDKVNMIRNKFYGGHDLWL
ncbi:MAG: glycosyltransferase family 4 protein [Gammaproteobacteria bacterium]|nr:glycosyltransferase family 4 protein [Gammaproteobacteria bacterium]